MQLGGPTMLSRPAAGRPRLGALALACGVLALALPLSMPSGAAEGGGGKLAGDIERVTVMTRNIYIGADLTPLTQARDEAELESAAADLLEEVVRTDFASRAVLLADEIARAKPDLVGLQEAVHYRFDRQDPDGSGPFDGPARETFQDFLSILKRELNAGAGPRYRVASEQREADVEVPIEDRRPGAEDPDFDVRATVRDVILARRGAGVRTAESKGRNFVNSLVIERAGARATILRGWTSIEADVRGARFRLVNTHLEAFDAHVRRKQAAELVAKGGPARSPQPVVLVGDLNSDDDSVHGRDRLAFREITEAGFLERQTRAFSCCYSAVLNDPNERFDHTVDHVMVDTSKIKLGRSFVTGDDPDRRTASGLWPSDHGGVVSVLHVPLSR
jgi:endonuclease/exonuclease/phosphatase family metal-dependent hydrolase